MKTNDDEDEDHLIPFLALPVHAVASGKYAIDKMNSSKSLKPASQLMTLCIVLRRSRSRARMVPTHVKWALSGERHSPEIMFAFRPVHERRLVETMHKQTIAVNRMAAIMALTLAFVDMCGERHDREIMFASLLRHAAKQGETMPGLNLVELTARRTAHRLEDT